MDPSQLPVLSIWKSKTNKKRNKKKTTEFFKLFSKGRRKKKKEKKHPTTAKYQHKFVSVCNSSVTFAPVEAPV